MKILYFLSTFGILLPGIHGRLLQELYEGSRDQDDVISMTGPNGDDVEVHVDTSKGYGNGSIVAVDFDKSLTALYVPKDKQCYLIGGVDHAVPHKKPQLDGCSSKPSVNLAYAQANDYAVKNKALFPEVLQKICSGKPVYWLERVKHDALSDNGWCFGVWVLTFCKT